MKRTKRIFSLAVVFLLTVFTLISNLPAKTASAAVVVPKIQFASPPVTQYNAGDRVGFNINAPNYGGRVQYRVVLWNDSEKTYYDLWNSGNGYPERYYTKWQPYGNEIFTLGWIIFDPGSYRITVYAKRAGIANSKTALKRYNCDSYMESVAFTVKSKETTVENILPVSDVTVIQGGTPTLPTKVKAAMSDGLTKELGVTWGTVNTSNPGTYTIEGTVAGTNKKAYVKVNVTAQAAINVSSVVSVSNYLVNVTLKDTIYTTPEASKFSIKTFNSNTIIPIQSVTLSSDKKTVALTTGYMTTNSWYTLTVNNNSYNFIANQGNTSGISLSAQNKEVAVNGTVYASVTKYPSDVILTYHSSNTSIATVNQTTGLITGKYPGVATITVYGNKSGYTQASTTFTVTVGGQSGMYVFAQDMEIGVGAQQMPVITKYPNDLTLTFTSNNPNIASVNNYTGMVTGVSQGTATITIAAYKYGYSTIYSTFTVTVRGQGMTLAATPVRLYESMANDGSLQSGVIDVTLTRGTFYNWGYYYYEDYVDIYNLPYGMDYTVAYVNANKLRVTITGAAYSNRNVDDATINITISKDVVNGATYDVVSNNIVLDFSDYPTPAAPTDPDVNDTNNTFGWTNVPGYTNYADYEYRIKNGNVWSTFATCTSNPISVGDKDIPVGGVEVRVKAASGRNAGYVLASNVKFTKAPINDNDAPVLKNLSMTLKGKTETFVSVPNSAGEYTVEVVKGSEISSMKIKVEDANLNTSPVDVYYAGRTDKWGTLTYSSGEWHLDMATCKNKVFDGASIAFEASFKDSKNTTKAVIYIEVIDPVVITDIKNIVVKDPIIQGSTYVMPADVEAIMSDGTTRRFAIDWEANIDTSILGIQTVEGTVMGYATKVKLTATVVPAPTIIRIADLVDGVEEGTPYTMPSQVLAFMSNGQQKLVNVTWNPETIDTGIPGTYEILGTVAGYTSKVKLTVTVTPVTIIKIDDMTKWAKLGQSFVMPVLVEAQMSNGTKRNVNVTWVPPTIDTSKAGVYEVFGTVVGYDKQVKLTIIISETQPTSK